MLESTIHEETPHGRNLPSSETTVESRETSVSKREPDDPLPSGKDYPEKSPQSSSSSQSLADGAETLMLAAGSAVTAGIGYGLFWFFTQG